MIDHKHFKTVHLEGEEKRLGSAIWKAKYLEKQRPPVKDTALMYRVYSTETLESKFVHIDILFPSNND